MFSSDTCTLVWILGTSILHGYDYPQVASGRVLFQNPGGKTITEKLCKFANFSTHT